MKKCKFCRKKIKLLAKTCPYCLEKQSFTAVIILFLVLIVLFFVLFHTFN